VSDQFSPVVYLIKSVMCKLILTKTIFRSLKVYDIEGIFPSPLTKDFLRKENLIYHYFEYVDCNTWLLVLVSLAKLQHCLCRTNSQCIYTNYRQPKSMHVLSENNIPYQRFSFLPWILRFHECNVTTLTITKGSNSYETNRRQTALANPRNQKHYFSC
jgi:hypothetical protein